MDMPMTRFKPPQLKLQQQGRPQEILVKKSGIISKYSNLCLSVNCVPLDLDSWPGGRESRIRSRAAVNM